jgi:hypothetical protein
MDKELQDISFAEMAKKVFVDYRICSDSLNTEELTNSLGITPSRAFAKGDKYLGKTKNPHSMEISQVWRERPRGIWAVDSRNLSNKIRVEGHICYLLDILEPKKRIIEQYLQQADIYTISTYIWWEPIGGQGGYEITNEVLQRLTSLCHYIEFGFIATE